MPCGLHRLVFLYATHQICLICRLKCLYDLGTETPLTRFLADTPLADAAIDFMLSLTLCMGRPAQDEDWALVENVATFPMG